MNFLDWLAVSISLLTLLGIQLQPSDPREALQQPDAGQTRGVATSTATLSIGGQPVLRFADSGALTADERAVIARQNIARAITHYDLARRYVPIGLRWSGNDALVSLEYLDLPLTTVSAADAKLAGAASARALAETWKRALDAQFRQVPAPTPDNWLVVTGTATARALVTEGTLARVVAGALPRQAAGVRVATEGARVVLTGTVDNDRVKRQVVSMVRDVPGVREVDDRIAIRQ